MVQELRLCTPSAGGMDLIPGPETKILHGMWHGQGGGKVSLNI